MLESLTKMPEYVVEKMLDMLDGICGGKHGMHHSKLMVELGAVNLLTKMIRLPSIP